MGPTSCNKVEGVALRRGATRLAILFLLAQLFSVARATV